MPVLLYSPGACSLAPHIVLEWIGEPYEARKVKLGSPELFQLNPAGSVPVFVEDDGWVLTQAGAILQYLERKFPTAGVGGGGNIRSQAELDRWLSFFTGDVHPSFYPVFMTNRYTTAKNEAALDAVRQAGLNLVRKRFKILNDHLAGRTYILGDSRSVVDAYAFPMMRWAIAKLPEKLSELPHVSALHDRIAEDAAVQKILAEENTTKDN